MLNDGTKIFLDGKEIINLDENNKKYYSYNRIQDYTSLVDSRAVKWGPWQTSTSTIKTGSTSTAIVMGIIGAAAPWVSVRVISAVAGVVAGAYSSIQMKITIRYGSDASYDYYERTTTFYGNGKKLGSFSDSGKKLNYTR